MSLPFFIIILLIMAVPLPLFNTDLLSLYEERLRRIVEECYEVAFILCNSELEDFGISKIFDVFNQIFTTAFILNTGYWPFFSSVKGQCLCVCGRFGLYCRHTKNDYHWVDMQSIENEQGAAKFFPRIYGNICPQDYDITIKPVIDESYGYNISTLLNLQYKKTERGRPVRREKANKSCKEQIVPKKEKDTSKQQTISYTIYARYNIHPEYYPAMFTIVFQPNPFFHDQYGTYFKKLCNLRMFEWPQTSSDHSKFYHVSVGQMPTSTLVLQHVNVPVFSMPSQILGIYHPIHYFKQKCQKAKRNKTCQTPWRLKIWNELEEETDTYSNKIREINNLWSYPDSSQILTESIRSIASNQLDVSSGDDAELIFMEDSEEYDNQLPNISYNKAVKGQGKKRKCSIWSNSTISTGILPNFTNFTTETDIKYCSTKSRKVENIYHIDFIDGMPFTLDTRQVFPYLFEEVNYCLDSRVAFPYLSAELPKINTSTLNYSEALKKPSLDSMRESNWFDKDFPPLKPKLNKKEIDEEFELIETVIKEDVSDQENNLMWWNGVSN